MKAAEWRWARIPACTCTGARMHAFKNIYIRPGAQHCAERHLWLRAVGLAQAGFLQDEQVLRRPADVLIDGAGLPGAQLRYTRMALGVKNISALGLDHSEAKTAEPARRQ